MSREDTIKYLKNHFNLCGKCYKPNIYGNLSDYIEKRERQARREVAEAITKDVIGAPNEDWYLWEELKDYLDKIIEANKE